MKKGVPFRVLPGYVERFWSKVEYTETCWLWTDALDNGGYGTFGTGTGPIGAHRYAYAAANGPIPEGMTIDHLCRVRHCVRPFHLEAVTMQENILRGVGQPAKNAAKTHCKYGHPFNESNTGRQPTGRRCKTCYEARLALRRGDLKLFPTG